MNAALLATLFLEPIPVNGFWRLLMLVPLALAVAIVYKTIRCEREKDIPAAAAALCVTIVVGMLAVGAALYAVYELLA